MRNKIDWHDPTVIVGVFALAIGIMTLHSIIVGSYNLLFLEESELVGERAVVEQICLSFNDRPDKLVVLKCSHGKIIFKDEKLWSRVSPKDDIIIYYSVVTNKNSGKIVEYKHYTDLSRKVEYNGPKEETCWLN